MWTQQRKLEAKRESSASACCSPGCKLCEDTYSLGGKKTKIVCPRERRAQACSKEGWCWFFCQALPCIQRKSKPFFKLSTFFPGFSWAYAGALPESYLSLQFYGGFMPALLQSHPFPRPSQASPTLLLWLPFWLLPGMCHSSACHLASTVHTLGDRNPSHPVLSSPLH